jgi:hypothetical protein
MKIHPLNAILIGLLISSIGFNILYHLDNQRLIYRIQKLEVGPAQGLFLDREIPLPKDEDKELNDLLKRMIKQMLRERTVSNKG